MVASTSTRLINRVPDQASAPTGEPHDDQQEQPGSSNQAESEEEEDQVAVREQTPDTNVKLNQPLRCGRYGQDLLPNKQHTVTADKAQSQDPGLGAGRNVNPALVASRQSTSAAPVVGKAGQAKAPKINVRSSALPPSGLPQMKQPSIGHPDGAVMRRPVQAASNAPAPAGRAAPAGPAAALPAAEGRAAPVSRAAPAGPAPASVDELLTGPVPRSNIMTASMAGAAAAMAESAAAMASGTAADREAVKAALGHHYRQYRAKKAAAVERAQAAPPAPQAASAAAADRLAGTRRPNPTGVPVSKASHTAVVTYQHANARLESSQQLDRLQYGLDTAAEEEEIPLQVKYGTSSSGGSSQACSSRSQDTATSYSFSQQPPKQQHAQQQHSRQHGMISQQQHSHSKQAGQSRVWDNQHQTPSRIHYKHSSAAQPQEAEPQQDRQLHQQPHGSVNGAGVQRVLPKEVEAQLAGATREVETDLRRSNEKLDMLLQSTVKRTQQAVSGKENKVRHIQAKVDVKRKCVVFVTKHIACYILLWFPASQSTQLGTLSTGPDSHPKHIGLRLAARLHVIADAMNARADVNSLGCVATCLPGGVHISRLVTG